MPNAESGSSSAALEAAVQRIDTSVPHPARRYNYWLGGKDNFQADRDSGDQIAAIFPTIRLTAQENRAFLRRAVTFLAQEAGIRQYLDIGTGIPTANNTHEVAQAIDPACRIVYADNDPVVLNHARALLTSTPEGATAYLDADFRKPEKILNHPDLLKTLDLSQPVALMLVAILHFIPDAEDPHGILTRLLDALPSGSYMVLSHGTSDFATEEERRAGEAALARGQHGTMLTRTRAELERFVTGLELVAPGIVPVAEWRAEGEPQPRPVPAEVPVYGVVARKP